MGVPLNWLAVLLPYACVRINTDLPADELYQRLTDETQSAVQRRHPSSKGSTRSRQKTPFYDYPVIRVFFAFRDYNIAVDRSANSFSVTDYIADRFPYQQFAQQVASTGTILPTTEGYTIELKMRWSYLSLLFIPLLVVCSVIPSQFLFLPPGLSIPWQLPIIYYCVFLITFQIKVKRLSIFLHELLDVS